MEPLLNGPSSMGENGEPKAGEEVVDGPHGGHEQEDGHEVEEVVAGVKEQGVPVRRTQQHLTTRHLVRVVNGHHFREETHQEDPHPNSVQHVEEVHQRP